MLKQIQKKSLIVKQQYRAFHAAKKTSSKKDKKESNDYLENGEYIVDDLEMSLNKKSNLFNTKSEVNNIQENFNNFA
jgi:hypothetical protein